MKKALIVGIILSAVPLLSLAAPINVDLTGFTQSSSGDATVSVPDASHANLWAGIDGLDHDNWLWVWLGGDAQLYNDSVPIPTNALAIQFDYDVSVIEYGGDAYFAAYLYDSGGSISPFSLTIDGPGSFSGTETWTISGESFVGGTVGLNFYVSASEPIPHGETVFAEVNAGISNVVITTSDVTPPTQPVPEASTLMLFGSGLSGLMFYVRKRRLTKS
jgi:hypothetical protein